MKNKSIYLELVATFIIFFIIAYFYRGPGLAGNIEKILTIATFLFAINLGFSIANRKSRLNSIRSLLRKNDAIILSIYESSKMYGKEVTDKTRTLIDDLLVAQIDNNILDFERSTPELIQLFNYSYTFDPKSSNKEGKDTMMSGCKDLLLSQKEVIYWVKDKMMLFEWISLLILGSIIVLCIYALSDGSILVMITLPLLATAIMLLLYVVRDISSLRWQEENWIWNRLIDLFEELDLPPYLIGILFRNKRLSKKMLDLPKEYRLVEYPHPYPNFKDKVVTLVKNEEQ